MKRFITTFILGGMLGGVAPPSAVAAEAIMCSPDMSTLVRLEAAARQKGPIGVTAKSALRYLAQEKLPTSGYFISKASSSGGKGKLAYHLYHESGFKKPCAIGNQSGKDGVLLVDATTHEVQRFLFEQ